MKRYSQTFSQVVNTLFLLLFDDSETIKNILLLISALALKNFADMVGSSSDLSSKKTIILSTNLSYPIRILYNIYSIDT